MLFWSVCDKKNTLFSVMVLAMFLALQAGPLAAQEWANKLFTTNSHDFGVVARNAKTEYRFEIYNPYVEDIVIDSVETSCTCTTPSIEKKQLQTYEKGAIIARFNTDRVLGSKSATLTVRISKPFRAIVELQISGFVRSDITFKPASGNFGTIPLNEEKSITATVTNTSWSGWSVKDIKSNNPHIKAKLVEVKGVPGGVSATFNITVDDKMPIGYLKDQIVIVTNDPVRNEIPYTLEGVVHGSVTLSPSTLFLGNVAPGQTVNKSVVVRGNKPFKITELKCGNPAIQADAPPESPSGLGKTLYVIPVVFKPTESTEPGNMNETVTILTDDPNVKLELTLVGEIEKR